MRIGSFGALEIGIIVLVILLVFGARRLPEIGASMGKGIRTFKTALMGEEEKIPVAGHVIWITPKGAQGKRSAGIGVKFSDQDQGNTQKRIENYLAGALGGDKLTHTL